MVIEADGAVSRVLLSYCVRSLDTTWQYSCVKLIQCFMRTCFYLPNHNRVRDKNNSIKPSGQAKQKDQKLENTTTNWQSQEVEQLNMNREGKGERNKLDYRQRGRQRGREGVRT